VLEKSISLNSYWVGSLIFGYLRSQLPHSLVPYSIWACWIRVPSKPTEWDYGYCVEALKNLGHIPLLIPFSETGLRW